MSKNVRWLVMAPDDLVVDDALSDDAKVKLLVSRGVLPRRPQLEIFWNDPESGYVISAADAAALRRPAPLGRHPKVYARLVWDRSQPSGGVMHGGKLRVVRGGKPRRRKPLPKGYRVRASTNPYTGKKTDVDLFAPAGDALGSFNTYGEARKIAALDARGQRRAAWPRVGGPPKRAHKKLRGGKQRGARLIAAATALKAAWK